MYYWNVVEVCTNGMLLGLVQLECCWGLYYWNVVGACTTGMLLGLVVMEFGNSYTTYASGTVVIICAPITLDFSRVLAQYKCICNLHNRWHD